MADVAGSIFYYDWELRRMEWLQERIGSSGFGFWLLSNLSAFGEQLLLVAVMGFLYWGLNKEFGKYLGLNVLMANVWNPMIKNVFLRLRPYFVPGYQVELLRPIDAEADIMDVTAQGYSFPSGHSTSAVAAYGSLAAHEKKNRLLWALAILLPLLVGFSRVFVGAHYPTDVLCGWLLGAAVVILVPWLRKKIKNRWLFYGVLLLSTVPGFFYCDSNDYFTSFGMLVGFVLAEPFEEKFVQFENTRNILRCLGVSDIKLQGKNLSPILFQFVTQNLKFLSIPSCEDKIIASLSKLAGTSLANSTGGTRDHHNFLHISFI